MNYVVGVFDRDEKLSESVMTTPIYKGKDIVMGLSGDVGAEIIQTHESERSYALLIGYLDQPLSGTSRSTLAGIVEGYERDGELPGQLLYGNFQLVLVDKVEQLVQLVGDKEGGRCWFVYEEGARTYFSTKLHPLKSVFHLDLQPNAMDLEFALIYGYYPSGRTVYAGVDRITPGHVLTLRKDGPVTRILSESSIDERPFQMETDVLDSLYNAFMAALNHQTSGHDRVAVHLGGFDSALMASMLTRLGKEVETFTFYYPGQKCQTYNQTHCDTLANYLNIKHNWITIDPDIYLREAKKYPQIFDRPTNWPNYVIQTAYLTYKIADRGFSFSVTGDGCDTLFQGYPGVNRGAVLYNRLSPIIKPVSTILPKIIQSKILEESLGHVYRLILRVIRNAGTPNPARTYLMMRIFDELTLVHLFGGQLREVEEKVKKEVERQVRTMPPNLSLHKLAYAGRANMGPNRTKMSGCMDVSGMPIFSPFMHHEIKAMVQQFPDELLRPQGSGHTMKDIGKDILIRMTQKHSLLPSEVIFQKKQAPVNSPIDSWYAKELAPWVIETIDRQTLSRDLDSAFARALSRPRWAEAIYKNTFSADHVTSHALSLLLTTLSYFQAKD